MLCTLSSDLLSSKVELCKCLCEERELVVDKNESVGEKLLCFSAMLRQDIVHHHLQSGYAGGQVL